MNPGLVVKLRPSGPWRIGPDSGARNRVDVIYHSDSLYSAVTAAMARLGWLEDWLDATARNGAPAVSFSSCFPYLDDIVFVVPPRTIWPPASPSAKAARVRWKSARFVPLTVVQSILAGRRLDENQWSVDGTSDCLVPSGSPGPFRTAVRWNAGVDRVTGASERHSTACIEFRAGSGLWTVVSFQDEAAETRWSGPVKAAFRLLADTGFGGERSRGWGRSEAPEFTEGMLPDLILPLPTEGGEAIEASVKAAAPVAPLTAGKESAGAESQPPVEAAPVTAPELPAVENALASEAEAPAHEPAPAPEPETPAAEPAAPAESESPVVEVAAAPEPETPAAETAPALEPESSTPEAAGAAEPEAPLVEPAAEAAATPESEAPVAPPASEAEPPATLSEPAAPQPDVPAGEAAQATESAAPAGDVVPGADVPVTEAIPAPEPEPPVAEVAPAETAGPEAPAVEPSPAVEPVAHAPTHAHWLLSVFTPAPADSVDWRRGNYTVLARGGRVDSPAGSGELKKQIQMVAEGSVLYAETAPRGSAANVAPDGFAHPVFRAGFAVAIPLPEVK